MSAHPLAFNARLGSNKLANSRAIAGRANKTLFAICDLDDCWAILGQLMYDVDRALGSLGPRPARWPYPRSPRLDEH